MVEMGLAPIYRYYTADLLTNEILAEIPFRGVSYERAIKSAGSFSGSIPVIEATKAMDIYESTMPGNTALYVVRNGVCVWGGVIWSRAYDVVGRVLNVSASEFTSYFYHRRFWKTWGHDYGATLTVTDGEIYAQLDNGSASSALKSGASVKLDFDNENYNRYNGFYLISSSPTPTYNTFGIDNAQTIAAVNVISRTDNIVTAITETAHGLVVNDSVTLSFSGDSGSEYAGTHVVLTVGGSEGTVFTFHMEGSNSPETDVTGSITRPIPDGTYQNVTISVRADTYDYVRSMVESVFSDFVGIDFPNTYIEPGISYNFEVIEKEVVDGVATLKTAEPHDLAPGQAVQVKNVDPIFDGEFYVTETRAVDEFSYELGGSVAATPVVVQSESIERVSATDGIVTVTTLDPHAFLVDQTVEMDTGTTEGGVGPMLNGVFTISEVISSTKFKYSSGYPNTIPEIVYDPANASSEVRRNYIENPNFEVNVTGWSTNYGTSRNRVTTEQYVGTASLQVDYGVGGGTLLSAYYTIPSTTGVSYTGSMYVKGPVGTIVTLEAVNTTGSKATSGPIPLDGDWLRISVTVAGPVSTNALGLMLTSSNAQTVYVDAVMIEQGSIPTEYFDGSTTDTYAHTYAWAGTANASASTEIHNIDVISAKITDNTVTLTTTEPPDFINGASVVVAGVYPQISIAEKSFDAASSKATITTDKDHNLQVGDLVNISGLRDYSSINARQVSGTQVTMHTNLSHNIFIGDVVTISDMKDTYFLTSKKIATDVATLTTSKAHNLAIGDVVDVFNIYDTYSITNKILTDNVATLTIDVPIGGGHNFAVNDSVTISGIIDTSNVISKVTENNVAILTMDFAHNFLENDDIIVSGLGAPFDGEFKVSSFTDTRITYEIEGELTDQIPLTAANGTVTSTKSRFNGDFVLSNVTATTISYNKTANNVLTESVSAGIAASASTLNGTHTITGTPATNKFTYAIDAYDLSETAIVPISEEYSLLPAATVESIHAGEHTVTKVSRNTFTFTQSGISNAVTLENTSGVVSVDSIFNGTSLTISARTADTFTYSLTAPSNILETPANSLAYVVAPTIYNGTFTLTSVNPDLNTIEYSKSHIDMPGTSIQGYGTATVNPLAIVSTFGPFPGNSDIGVQFSTKAYSGKRVLPTPYRGFELVNVGEALSKYSDSIDGFEYRIDCSYDAEFNEFKKTFVIIPIDFPNPPAAGEVSPISRFGADKLVFEYPGNIINLNLEESAENSATRFFAVGENDLGPDAGPPFSVASANGLLRGVDSVRKWPLLDDDEKVPDVDDDGILYGYANRYLSEARPPDAKLGLSVNGSLQPSVGQYAPGDWCSLIVNDQFILERLQSNLEPRDSVIVRKIDVIKVSVPDGTTFPEKVDLTLVPEWEVDKRG